jgi:vanillate O-demethylase monooxygenase subunit
MNTWYAAGFSEDFGRAPVVRTLLDEPIVFYRTEAGEPIALRDRCPHRFAPLHKGKVLGDAIRCPYHGLRFGAGGTCVHNPIGDGKIPRAAQTKAYPLAEHDGIVWIWFGDQPADESNIRRWPEFVDVERYTSVQGYIYIKANYQLVSDNLLDLSHAEFLHPYLATEGFNRRTQYSMEQDGNTVIARNWRPNEPISGLFAAAWGDGAPTNVDHLSIVRWQPPASLHLEIGVTGVGRPPEEGPRSFQAHLITPETEHTSHYFWKWARDFKLGDEEFSARLQASLQGAFETEDGPMIEAQSRYMDGQPLEALKPVLLATDSASIRARRVLTQLIQEQAGA